MNNSTNAETSANDHVAPVLLSLSFASFAFICVLFAFRRGGIVEREEFQIFSLAWATIPAVTVASMHFSRRPLAKWVGASPDVRTIVLVAHAGFWGRFVAMFHHAFPSGTVSLIVDDLGPPLLGQIEFFCFGNVILLIVGAALHRFAPFDSAGPETRRITMRVRSAVDFALPFVICCFAVPFDNRTLHSLPPYVVSLFCGIAAFAFGNVLGPAKPRAGRRKDRSDFAATRARRRSVIARGFLFAVVLVLVSFDPFHDLHTESHYYFLGAVAAVMAGKSLLVTVNCQYGVVVIYFIAFLMKEHVIASSYVGFAHLLATLLVLHFFLCFWILRVATRNFLVAAATTLLLVIVVQYGQLDYASWFPSAGPLRFGLAWLFVAGIAFEGRYPRRRWIATAAAPITVGLASVWSFEAFTYVFVAYAGLLAFDALHATRWFDVVALWRRVVPVVVCIVLAHAILAMATYERSHHWPQWRMYFDYILLYSRGEFGTMLIPTWSPWAIVSGIYLLSLLALGYRRFVLGNRSLDDRALQPRLLFVITAIGIAQYTYFLGRSHPNNLFHVATPAIILAVCWVAWLAKRPAGASNAFRIATIYASVAGAAFLLFTCLPDFFHKFDHSLLSLATSPRTIEPVAENARGKDAAALMNKLAPTLRKVLLMTEPDAEVDAFLRSGKAEIWPISYIPADTILPSANDAILEFVSPLREGDMVFLDIGSSGADLRKRPGEVLDHPLLSREVSAVEQIIFGQIAAHFSFRIVEQSEHGILAARLARRRR